MTDDLTPANNDATMAVVEWGEVSLGEAKRKVLLISWRHRDGSGAVEDARKLKGLNGLLKSEMSLTSALVDLKFIVVAVNEVLEARHEIISSHVSTSLVVKMSHVR